MLRRRTPGGSGRILTSLALIGVVMLALVFAGAAQPTPEPTAPTPEPTPAPTKRRHNPNDGLSDHEVDVLSGLSIGFSIVSFIGSAFILACFAWFKDLRSFAFRLVFFMSLADLGFSVGKFFGDAGGDHSDHTHPACTVQALLISFFSLSSIAWCVCIAHTLHQAIIRRNPEYAPRSVPAKLPLFYAFSWGLPLLLTILPSFSGSYGDTGAWCWIKTEESVDVFWRYVCFYIPLWLAIPYNAYVYVLVRRSIRAMDGGQGDDGDGAGESSRQMVRRIIFYPLVLVICFLPATINRTYEAVTNDRQAWLTGFHIIFATSLGLGNAIVYGLEQSVRARILALLCGGRKDLLEDDGTGPDLSVSLHALDPRDLRHAEHLEL